EDTHPRIQAALLRHVAEPQPRLSIDRAALPADLASVGLDETEDAAHRRGLARAIRPEEADDPAGSGGEGRPVERHDRSVAFGEVIDLEHLVPRCRHLNGTRRTAERFAIGHASHRTTPGRNPGSWHYRGDVGLLDD